MDDDPVFVVVERVIAAQAPFSTPTDDAITASVSDEATIDLVVHAGKPQSVPH